ncbi:hypothetical protein [Actinoallomurus acanthiterrae]
MPGGRRSPEDGTQMARWDATTAEPVRHQHIIQVHTARALRPGE